MTFKRYQDETEEQYIYRIGNARKENNLTWEQVAEVINEELGESKGESAYRKRYKAMKDGYDMAVVDNVESDEVLVELEEKRKELEIAKIQYQDKTREYKKYLRHEARLDNLLQNLINEIKDDINAARPLDWKVPVKDVTKENTALTLLLSDLHKGMLTDNHWNKYDNDVFIRRIEQLQKETIQYQKITNAKELHIMQLGDLIHGAIHRITQLAQSEDAIRQTQGVAEALASLVAVLAQHFETVHFHSVKGNHDRTSTRKEEEIKTESFHDFVPWYMKARLGTDKNVVFHDNEIDSEIIVAEIMGNTYFGVHGHLDTRKSMVQNLTLMLKKFPTAIFSGHIHKNFEDEVHGVDIIVNGSFAGTDNYAKDARLTSKAHQKLLWLDGNGRKATFYINLK